MLCIPNFIVCVCVSLFFYYYFSFSLFVFISLHRRNIEEWEWTRDNTRITHWIRIWFLMNLKSLSIFVDEWANQKMERKRGKHRFSLIIFDDDDDDTTDTVQPTECRSYDNKYLLLNVVVNVSVAFGLYDIGFGHFTKNPICTTPGNELWISFISLPPCTVTVVVVIVIVGL